MTDTYMTLPMTWLCLSGCFGGHPIGFSDEAKFLKARSRRHVESYTSNVFIYIYIQKNIYMQDQIPNDPQVYF